MPPSPSITLRIKKTPRRPGRRRLDFHPLLVLLDRPDIVAGEALAGLLPTKLADLSKWSTGPRLTQ